MEPLRLLLLILMGLPLAAAVVVALLGPSRRELVRRLTLAVVLLNLVLAVVLVVGATPRLRDRPADSPGTRAPTFQPILIPGEGDIPNRTTWDLLPLSLPGTDEGTGRPGAVQFYVGIDGLNLWLVALTAVLMVSAVLASWNLIKDRSNEYYAWLLVLNTGMMGVFLAFDIVLFYVCFELTLVPLFFLVGVWGGPAKREAARKLFLFTLAGSLITLVGMLAVVSACAGKNSQVSLTFAIPDLVRIFNEQHRTADPTYGRNLQTFVFLTLCVGFAVKVPLVPIHSWLPLAYSEAPTPATFLLAGVLAKMGTYGLLRLALPLAPDASLAIGLPLLGTLAAVGILYGALCAFAQTDLKRLIAYSSVSHLGFCVLGLFALNAAGLTGGLLHMVNHGLAVGALFLLVGMLAERYQTRQIAEYGGMYARLQKLTVVMVLVCLASIGLPGLNSFVGEALMLGGVIQLDGTKAGPWLFGAAVLGIVLGAWYLLTMLQRVFFGPLKEPSPAGRQPATDLTGREMAAVLPLAGLCVVLGLFPQPLLDTAARDIGVITQLADDARVRTAGPGP